MNTNGVKAKNTNNERWYECKECSFIFTIYKALGRGRVPCCPSCGESFAVVKVEASALSARENYRPWQDEELVVIEKLIRGEMYPFQCALELDRSISSVACKARRIKRRRKEGMEND